MVAPISYEICKGSPGLQACTSNTKFIIYKTIISITWVGANDEQDLLVGTKEA